MSNRPQLEQAAALARMREILQARNPSKILSDAEGLIEKVETDNKVRGAGPEQVACRD